MSCDEFTDGLSAVCLSTAVWVRVLLVLGDILVNMVESIRFEFEFKFLSYFLPYLG